MPVSRATREGFPRDHENTRSGRMFAMMTADNEMNGRVVRARADGAPWRNFYGRRQGRKLRSGQASRLEARLRELEPPGIGWDVNPERRALAPSRLWPGKEIWLEIGFGGGEHMLATASRNPHVQIIGADRFMNGVAK